MKKLWIILLCLLLTLLACAEGNAPQATKSNEPEYDELILHPDDYYGAKMLINGTVMEIREQDTDDGNIQTLIIIEQKDGPINPIALFDTRPANCVLGIKEDWRIAFNGLFKVVWNIRNAWGFYVAMPVFENEAGSMIYALPADMELPEYMVK